MPAERGAAATRELILDAALAVFTEYTFGSTSMSVLAQRAGVAVGSIYRHFPSKEALGNAVYRHWKGYALDRLRHEVDLDAPARVAFGQLWRTLTSFATEHGDAFAFMEFQQHEGYLDEQSRELTGEMFAIAIEVFTRGQRAGEIRAGDVDVLIALSYGALVGLAKAVWAGLPAERAAGAEDAVWALLRATP